MGLAMVFTIWCLGLAVPYRLPLAAIAMSCIFIVYAFFEWTRIPGKLKTTWTALRLTLKSLALAKFLFLTIFLLIAIPNYGVSPQLNSALHRSICFAMFFVMFLLEIGPSRVFKWLETVSKFLTVAFTITACVGLYKYYISFKGVYIFYSAGDEGVWTRFTTSLVRDYNMYALGCIIGYLAAIGLSIKSRALRWPILGIMLTNIVLAGSRRGIILLLILALVYCFSCIKDAIKTKSFAALTPTAGLVLAMLAIQPISAAFHKIFPASSKEKIAEILGFDYGIVAAHFPVLAFRYETIWNTNADLRQIRAKYATGDDKNSTDIKTLLDPDGGKQEPEGELPAFNNNDNKQSPARNFNPSDGFRLGRYRYALDLFSSYTLGEKLFGGGFAYHKLFEVYFSESETIQPTGIDYPHQPFLSVLLFSGIFGLVVFSLSLFSICFYRHHLTSKWFWSAFSVYFFCFFSMDIPFTYYLFSFFWTLPIVLGQINHSEISSGNGHSNHL